MTDTPRLRGKSGAHSGPWPIGQIPEEIIYKVGKQIVHRLAIGQADITGDDFGNIFATAVGGLHYASPLGLADVALNDTGWSVKTLQSKNPYSQKSVRLISGRNSPDYSLGIENPHTNLQKTGDAILSVWNSRLNKARDEHDDVRVAVLVRNMDTKEFLLFEEELARHATGDYEWRKNKNGNLQGHRKSDEKHCFTWQFHGSQFTIIRDIPGSGTHFKINRSVPLITPAQVEKIIKYQNDWIAIFKSD